MTTIFRLTCVPPSTNNLFLNGTKGRFRSQKYDTWLQEAHVDYLRQRPKPVTGPVHITMEFQESGRRRDIDNMLKAPLDFCVKSGIIQADDNSIVRSISAKWSDEVEGCKVTVSSIFSSVASASPETKSQGQHDAPEHRNQDVRSTDGLHGVRFRS